MTDRPPHPAPPRAAARADRARWLRDQIEALPPFDAGDPLGWNRRFREAEAALLRRIAQLTDRPRVIDTGLAARVTMLGLTATSTGGATAALRNWITRATT